ncbi:MAG TPA: hypothetical protein VL404_02020 [Candidatus Eisenbacteria bacterium]|nr:hypothetical protein [Candidatus Eisenbacteria bacterium]
MTKRMMVALPLLAALSLAGCVSTHTERVVEKEVPSSTTTVVR